MAPHRPGHRHLRRARARALERAGTPRRCLLAAHLRRRGPARRRDRADARRPTPRRPRTPTRSLDLLDGLILAGGADIDPAPTAPSATRRRATRVPERDAFEIALARARARARPARARHLPRHAAASTSRCGGTLHPAPARRRRPRASTGASLGLLRRRRPRRRASPPGSLAARAAGELGHATKSHHHQGVDALGEGLVVTGLERARRPARGDRAPGLPLRARRAVASRGRPSSAVIARGGRRARRRGARGHSRSRWASSSSTAARRGSTPFTGPPPRVEVQDVARTGRALASAPGRRSTCSPGSSGGCPIATFHVRRCPRRCTGPARAPRRRPRADTSVVIAPAAARLRLPPVILAALCAGRPPSAWWRARRSPPASRRRSCAAG